jgi:hypothetical protein
VKGKKEINNERKLKKKEKTRKKKEKKKRKKCNGLTLLPRVLIRDRIPNFVRAPTSPICQRPKQLDRLRKKKLSERAWYCHS